MNKQLQVFLTRRDEEQLSLLLREEFAAILFLDGNVWPDCPDCRESIEQCDTNIVYLYCKPLDELPTLRRQDGQLEGPAAGCVIQILRSVEKDRVLLSGRIAVGANDNDGFMSDFSSGVWGCAKKIGATGVVRPDGRVDKNYLVGYDTQRAIEHEGLQIQDRPTKLSYTLPKLV